MIPIHCVSKIGNIIRVINRTLHILKKKKKSCFEANIATVHVN